MSDYAEHHDELRAVARDLLGAADATSGPDWVLLAESGWLGLEVPEAQGGAGATFAEVAIVLEELGRAAAASPYLGSVVLGVGALRLAEPTAARADLLAAVAAGSARIAVALPGSDEADATPAPFRLSADGRLQGRAGFVVDPCEADSLLLPAVDEDDHVHLAVVHPDGPGIEVAAQPVLDATRRLGTVTATGADPADVLRFAGDGPAAIRQLRDRAAVAIALDSLGLSEAMLALTVTYTSARHQFGRAIGSFQAVKHACADMAVEAAVTRELVDVAVAQVVAGAPDGGIAAAMAASYATETGLRAAGTALQLHGGIGYTWESGLHVHLKRAALNRSLFGSPAGHRQVLAARYV